MENEMIVRVARAIQASVLLTHDEANDAARAAIAAMRNPTEAMLNASWLAPDAPFRAIEDGMDAGIKSIYQAMIDAALKPE